MGSITFTVSSPEHKSGESATCSHLQNVAPGEEDQNVIIESLNGSRPGEKYIGKARGRTWLVVIRIDGSASTMETALDAWDAVRACRGSVVIASHSWRNGTYPNMRLLSVERPERLPANSVEVILTFLET